MFKTTFATSLVAVAVSAYRLKSDPLCEDNDHLVGSLPYWAEDSALFPCQYAGTVYSNEEETHNMFYWMYPAENPDAPVTIWLNGGPGASSSFANFLMNGPQRINHFGPGVDDYAVTIAKEGSWVDASTMIFIDQPIGTGFSWCTDCDDRLTNMDDAADEFLIMLENLWLKYPQFVGRDFYITGESYGGKYQPRYVWEILERNRKIGEPRYNIKATLVGDPYTAPLTQRTSMYIVPEALNIIDDSNMPQIAALIRRCQEEIAIDEYQACDDCRDIVNYISKVSGNVFGYDTRIFKYDWQPTQDMVTDYLANSGQTTQLYEQLHVTESTKVPVFQMESHSVGEAFWPTQLENFAWYFEDIIRQELPVLIYAGEFDAKDGPKTQEPWLRRLAFNDSVEFWDQSRKVYYVPDPVSGNQIIGGYYREVPNFTYLTVPKAGHFVPNNYYQPSYQFFFDYLNNQSLQCHNPDGCSVVDAQCDYMNQCSEHGTCGANGQCTCVNGWKGADCSLKNNELVDTYYHSFMSNGPKWFSFSHTPANWYCEASVLRLRSITYAMDIYITADAKADVNQFSYDMVFKNQRDISLSSELIGALCGSSGYSVAVYVDGVNENKNQLLSNTLRVNFDMI